MKPVKNRYFIDKKIIFVCWLFYANTSLTQDSLFVKESDLSVLYINFGKGCFKECHNGDLITMAPEYDLSGYFRPFVLIRQTKSGEVIWATKIHNIYAHSNLTEDSLGNLYIVSSDTLYKTQLLKLSSNGVEQWRVNCDSQSNTKTVFIHTNHIYLIGTYPAGSSTYHYFMTKFDLDGNIIWTKTLFIGYEIEICESIKTNDGNFLVTANYNQSLAFIENYMHIMKIDTNAIVIWSKKISVLKDHIVYDIHEATNGDFVLTGAVYDPDPDIFFLRLSSQGEVLASCLYHNKNYQESFGITQTSDGNFMICAEPESYFNKTKPQLAMMKVNPQGTVIDFVLQDIATGGFFPIGFVLSDSFFYISGIELDDFHLTLVKTNEQGYTKCFDHNETMPIIAENLVSSDKLVYDNPGPNFTLQATNQEFISVNITTVCSALAEEPAIIHYLPQVPNVFTPDDDGINDEFVIDYPYEEGYELVILDRWGQTVFISNSPTKSWNGTIQRNGEEATAGVYFYSLTCGTLKKHGFLTLIR